MKNYLSLLLILFVTAQSKAQLIPKASCPEFKADILKGEVSGVLPDFTIGQIKAKLPCSTSEEEESKTARCGGGIFYKTKDVYFYTQRDYIEIGPAFKGSFTFPVLNTPRGSLFNRLGNPSLKDADWDAYQTRYGVVVLFYKQNKVNKVIISTKGTDQLDLCQ